METFPIKFDSTFSPPKPLNSAIWSATLRQKTGFKLRMTLLKFGCVGLLVFLRFVESGWSATIVGGEMIAHWSGKGNMFKWKPTGNFSMER